VCQERAQNGLHACRGTFLIWCTSFMAICVRQLIRFFEEEQEQQDKGMCTSKTERSLAKRKADFPSFLGIICHGTHTMARIMTNGGIAAKRSLAVKGTSFDFTMDLPMYVAAEDVLAVLFWP
jgi:hypothetical protein